MHILLLEDDSLIRTSLQGMLAEFGRIHPAASLQEAYAILDKRSVELALIDRRLPDGDGTELVEYLQDASPTTKSLLITGLSGLPDRLKGWRAGADDYIAKPFSREEVRLRVARLLRLHKEAANQWVECGELRFNVLSGEVSFKNKPISLRPKEFAILVALWRNREHTVTKDILITQVWGTIDRPNKQSVDVYLRRLRMKLRNTSVSITTIHSYGYMLTVERHK